VETDPEVFWQEELQRFLPDPAGALEEAFGYVCCPICQVLVDVPWDFFRFLPGRWSEEPDLRAMVTRAGGFCNHHVWRLMGMQSLVVIARVFVDVLDELVVREPQDLEVCPVCRLEEMATERLLGELTAHLRIEENRERFVRLFGLCYPHWLALLRRDLPAPLREFLIQAQDASTERLGEHLRGFLEKDTLELKGTRTREENRAPRHAVLKAAGNQEI